MTTLHFIGAWVVYSIAVVTALIGAYVAHDRLAVWHRERRRVREMRREVDQYIETCATLAGRRPPSRLHRLRVRIREWLRESLDYREGYGVTRNPDGSPVAVVDRQVRG